MESCLLLGLCLKVVTDSCCWCVCPSLCRKAALLNVAVCPALLPMLPTGAITPVSMWIHLLFHPALAMASPRCAHGCPYGNRGFLPLPRASFLRWAHVPFEALKQIALFVALLKTWLEVVGFPSEVQWFIISIFLLFYWHSLEISLLFIFMHHFLEACGEDKIEKSYLKEKAVKLNLLHFSFSGTVGRNLLRGSCLDSLWSSFRNPGTCIMLDLEKVWVHVSTINPGRCSTGEFRSMVCKVSVGDTNRGQQRTANVSEVSHRCLSRQELDPNSSWEQIWSHSTIDHHHIHRFDIAGLCLQREKHDFG